MGSEKHLWTCLWHSILTEINELAWTRRGKMKGGTRRSVWKRGKITTERRRWKEGVFGQVGSFRLGACPKALRRRKDDETANCKESCDSVEGDWLWHCLRSNAPPQTQEIAEQFLPPPNVLGTVPPSCLLHCSVLINVCVCVCLGVSVCKRRLYCGPSLASLSELGFLHNIQETW